MNWLTLARGFILAKRSTLRRDSGAELRRADITVDVLNSPDVPLLKANKVDP